MSHSCKHTPRSCSIYCRWQHRDIYPTLGGRQTDRQTQLRSWILNLRVPLSSSTDCCHDNSHQPGRCRPPGVTVHQLLVESRAVVRRRGGSSGSVLLSSTLLRKAAKWKLTGASARSALLAASALSKSISQMMKLEGLWPSDLCIIQLESSRAVIRILT